MIATALSQLNALTDPQKAIEALAYHKTERPYLGLKVPQIEELTDAWRAELTLDDRIQLAADLWDSNIHDARIAASKLLTQARIKPDDAAWDLICQWVPQFDAWAIADTASVAAQKRITADPTRIETVETWITSENMWTRRAALVATLPFTKQNFPKPFELDIRDRVLGWASVYIDDKDWFIQKAVAWWLRDLSKHDPARTADFLNEHGERMKTFARKEAAQYLG
ncbi:MAG: alkylation repair protein [Cypionkella sp.]|uniref:DNA alkylation repair protein n=1 Tax=Cypionkella sp. TaxID=2811411 RepID=UPI002635410F|nr:DNA alkylation repair protein [Cypionkella sp.]MDB5657796.1 alkylation repair protein [Cypionkella sp.]